MDFVSSSPLFSTLSSCFSRKTVDTEYTYYSWCMTSTDIVKWRKTNDYENFEKEWFIWKFWKRGGGSREKGEEETKSMPHASVININNNNIFTCIICFHSKAPVLSITVIYQYSFFNTPTVFVQSNLIVS